MDAELFIYSPISVFENENTSENGPNAKSVDDAAIDAKNGDSTFTSKAIAQEQKCLDNTVKEQDAEKEKLPEDASSLNDAQFSKLDELLTQAQLYSQSLLEKMDDITLSGVENQKEEPNNGKAKGRGSKRKASAQYNDKKAKRAVAAMLSRLQEGTSVEDAQLTEEEKAAKEQSELIPLLTGGQLKPYQLKGVKWLISLWKNGLNGILADQMGLGKTIQTIGFLAHLKGKGLEGPYMVIAPLSTLSHWVTEITRFVPSVKAIIYHGDMKKRKELRLFHMPKMGHRLKNSNCKLLRELKLFSIENKLLLTGTPLQNNLAELWSLLNFILPDIFSSREEFESWFDLSGKCSNEVIKEEQEEKRRVQVVARLHAILRPFILRRMKADVEQMLPQKKEIILYATMTDRQKNFQEHLVNKTLENYLVENVSCGSSLHGVKGKLNNLMVQLLKNCNHPDLLESAFDGSYFYPPVEQIVEQCGKFHLLDRLLTQLFVRKHKVLIFSQWTKVLDIMDYYFSEKGFKLCRIDGNVKLDERKIQIQVFNDVNSDYRIFLLSTRAGGLGINLTAADTCIIYDSDWVRVFINITLKWICKQWIVVTELVKLSLFMFTDLPLHSPLRDAF